MYGHPVAHSEPHLPKSGNYQVFYLPPKCCELFGPTDASEIVSNAISRWSGHVREIAPISRRDHQFIKVPHRDGSRRVGIEIYDTDVALWEKDSTIAWEAGMRDYVTDFRSYVITALQFASEVRI